MFSAVVSTCLLAVADLPSGPAPAPVDFPHFPSRLHAFVWRNWQLVPAGRMAEVAGATEEQIRRMGKAMGLSDQPPITSEQRSRSYITVIRRNWHLLPYEQLLKLLDWTPEQMAYTLREDDFLLHKLGSLKPKCQPVAYREPDADVLAREKAIARIVRRDFPDGVGLTEEPLFGFVADLCSQERAPTGAARTDSVFSPRYCYSYFALYGDPLMDAETDPFPDAYLARMAASGADGVWMQAVLYKLAPFPWEPSLSENHEQRLANLKSLVARARSHGMGIYLYLNEPRAMPLAFYEKHPELKGVVEGDHAALCTSVPAVQEFIVDSVERICRAVPDLAGLFTISASENLSNCWSHHRGKECPRCSKRSAQEVIAELHGLIRKGIERAGSSTRLIAWDWGWQDAWAEGIINRLPEDVALMSVSEWSIPIKRGGVSSVVGEYSISTVGPGPRATRHWGFAQKRGLKTLAKIQANTTWEIGAVPYVPAIANVSRHAANLCGAGVDGLMLGWTLGGYPSPNLEVVAEIGRLAEDGGGAVDVDKAMLSVAQRRFGKALAPAVVKAWQDFSTAFSEFPFNIGLVYTAPVHMGPANNLWEKPTGYSATMVGLPYDDLDRWRTVYPPQVFIGQFDKIADGFERTINELKKGSAGVQKDLTATQRKNLEGELSVAETVAIHYRSTANQARFVVARRALEAAKTSEEAKPHAEMLERVLNDECALARRLHAIQGSDSRIGFEATNHYFYVPVDLAEKVINCRDLLERWLPAIRKKRGL